MHCCSRAFTEGLRPNPNTFPIRSLPGVNFCVFHIRDLTSFLIQLLRAFTFYHHFLFFFCFFHFMQPFNNVCFSSHNHDAYEMQYFHISLSTIIPRQFLLNADMLNNSNTQHKHFSTIKSPPTSKKIPNNPYIKRNTIYTTTI